MSIDLGANQSIKHLKGVFLSGTEMSTLYLYVNRFFSVAVFFTILEYLLSRFCLCRGEFENTGFRKPK